MKKLTKITPEPEHHIPDPDLKWLSEKYNHGITDPTWLIRYLIHKNNELTEAVTELQEKIKELTSK